ncbi:MAG TPA: hypothetical protein VGQ72_10600 [Pyrinomonadaceae bacterium]|jgi:hypothetical protein|nr:hypothetical protein [Pyrinomonadaceae bacterium]
MKRELGTEESKAFATGLLHGVEIVADYMAICYPAISEAEGSPETGYKTGCMKRLWLRAYVWMNTLRRLTDPLDFQAIAVGSRALFEILVDLILLHHDKTHELAAKMFWWGESEKLRASEQIISFYDNQSLNVPDEFEAQVLFCKTEKVKIENMRQTHWPNRKDPKRHPKRWTGNRYLSEDVEQADKIYSSVLTSEIRTTLTEFYRTQYPKMNWQIHSSVLGLDQPSEGFYLTVGSSFKRCADLAMLCTRIVLSDFDLDITLQKTGNDWNRIRHKQDSAFAAALYNFHSNRNP